MVDLQYRLIRAGDPGSAYLRALALGASGSHDYRNRAGQRVSWEFLGLNDLREIEDDELTDGVEVYSWMERAKPADFITPRTGLQVFANEANRRRTIDDMAAELGEDPPAEFPGFRAEEP